MPITDWPACERPREKLLQAGAATLSDAELLAVFLRVGAAGKTALDLSRELIGSFGSLTQLFAADAQRLAAFKGMGDAKYAQLQVVPELARRALAESLRTPRTLGTSRAVRDYLRLTLAQLPYEAFYCLYLDTHHGLIASAELFRGSLRQASIYPREVAREALIHNAASVIVAHNHPGGVAAPSRSDVTTTRRLVRALGTLDIDLLDHYIVAGSETYSFAEHDLLPCPDVMPETRRHTP
ncbi:RadC family protein [Cupriavidus pampae]|uniref:MPN domain-containing protein n=1 Tax=Cupriavidus pampae TaxID=659251 RepID=A0ABM8XG39_9BURK|nr:DNA repair protein RadC [Cupriavidus pampae]CAG9178898.1 hypothetical protein LMG32289_04215 [Cupriavidus pampae]